MSFELHEWFVFSKAVKIAYLSRIINSCSVLLSDVVLSQTPWSPKIRTKEFGSCLWIELIKVGRISSVKMFDCLTKCSVYFFKSSAESERWDVTVWPMGL